MGDGKPEPPPPTEHLNIKVTDGNNEVFFKIKKTTPLRKLMDAFCERQGKQANTVRFLFDGTRVRHDDTPDAVSWPLCLWSHRPCQGHLNLEMYIIIFSHSPSLTFIF